MAPRETWGAFDRAASPGGGAAARLGGAVVEAMFVQG